MKSQSSFLSIEELNEIGLKSLGQNVLISRLAHFYSPESIEIGNNVRIDDFCILSGNIKLGSFIHISAYCALYGKFGIEIEDYSGLSPRSTLFSASDDFSGDYLVGPMVPYELTNVTGGKVILKRFVQIGAGSVILPNLTINQGVAIGALSLVRKSLDEWNIYAGNPLKLIKPRNRKLLKYYEQHFKG
jgi:galactoside O-acetyltransferase